MPRSRSRSARVVRIVPFGAAGGPIDTLARAYAERLGQRWSQSVIVDPKPGASGVIAADFVAKAAPDGHTVLFTLSLTHVNVPILQSKVTYDPVKDFTPLSMLATGGPMIVARANAPPICRMCRTRQKPWCITISLTRRSILPGRIQPVRARKCKREK